MSVPPFCCKPFQLLPSHFRINLSLLIYADFDTDSLFKVRIQTNSLPKGENAIPVQVKNVRLGP